MICDTVRLPTEVLTDRGSEFVGLKDFVSLHRRTAAYRPQSKSRLERKHRKIGNLCRTNDIGPLDAVLLLNDDNVERLFGENRPDVDDLNAGDFCLRYAQRKQREKCDDVWEGPYMVTAQLGDRTFELESEFVVDIYDLRVFRYSDLCRCSKDAFCRCLALWGLDGIEKDFVDVFGSISGYSYRRDRDGWSIDWTDQRVLINTDLRLLFDALLKLLT
jgi:hypothetical protein